MYFKVDELKALCDVMKLLPSGDEFNALPQADQDAIIRAESALIRLCHRKKDSNSKTAAYIAERRKANKNYARTPYQKKGDING